MNYSDYIVYVDESGDHSLVSIDDNYPIFVLAFCVFKKDEYARQVSPALQEFKFRWLGRDTVVLHEREIRQKTPPFSFLQKTSRRDAFMNELTDILDAAPMMIISTVIRKDRHKRQYADPESPYHLSLLFCMERLQEFLVANGQAGRSTHMIFEQRGGKDNGGKEDKELEHEFFRIKSGNHYLARGDTFPDLELEIVSKKANSAGLQIADLVARPIGLSITKPGQDNRAMDVIRTKVRADGIKVFP